MIFHGLPMWWASIVPILGFLGLSNIELGQGMQQKDRRMDRQRPSFYNAPSYGGRGIINHLNCWNDYNMMTTPYNVLTPEY